MEFPFEPHGRQTVMVVARTADTAFLHFATEQDDIWLINPLPEVAESVLGVRPSGTYAVAMDLGLVAEYRRRGIPTICICRLDCDEYDSSDADSTFVRLPYDSARDITSEELKYPLEHYVGPLGMAVLSLVQYGRTFHIFSWNQYIEPSGIARGPMFRLRILTGGSELLAMQGLSLTPERSWKRKLRQKLFALLYRLTFRHALRNLTNFWICHWLLEAGVSIQGQVTLGASSHRLISRWPAIMRRGC